MTNIFGSSEIVSAKESKVEAALTKLIVLCVAFMFKIFSLLIPCLKGTTFGFDVSRFLAIIACSSVPVLPEVWSSLIEHELSRLIWSYALSGYDQEEDTTVNFNWNMIQSDWARTWQRDDVSFSHEIWVCNQAILMNFDRNKRRPSMEKSLCLLYQNLEMSRFRSYCEWWSSLEQWYRLCTWGDKIDIYEFPEAWARDTEIERETKRHKIQTVNYLKQAIQHHHTN